MSEYLLRKGKLFYEIAKFEDTKDSIAVYLFTQRGCSCPSYRKNCKHLTILNTWKASGEIPGVVYDDNAEVIGNLSVA
jgi:hypothetical protein